MKKDSILGSSRSVRSYCANERLNLAIIGAGGRGAANLRAMAGENIVALCDVNEQRAAHSFATYPQAKKYHDYRRLLDDMEREIDAVVVSTPNHHHAPASVMAMRRGKHVYCEKPGAHSVFEPKWRPSNLSPRNWAPSVTPRRYSPRWYVWFGTG